MEIVSRSDYWGGSKDKEKIANKSRIVLLAFSCKGRTWISTFENAELLNIAKKNKTKKTNETVRASQSVPNFSEAIDELRNLISCLLSYRKLILPTEARGSKKVPSAVGENAHNPYHPLCHRRGGQFLSCAKRASHVNYVRSKPLTFARLKLTSYALRAEVVRVHACVHAYVYVRAPYARCIEDPGEHAIIRCGYVNRVFLSMSFEIRANLGATLTTAVNRSYSSRSHAYAPGLVISYRKLESFADIH